MTKSGPTDTRMPFKARQLLRFGDGRVLGAEGVCGRPAAVVWLSVWRYR